MKKQTLLVTVLVLGGCTTELGVSRLTDSTKTPITGFTYSLPFTQFEITAVRTLKSCQDNGSGPIRLVFAYALTAPSATNLPDASQTYVVDYQTLASGWKISDLKLQNFPSGMLQQINASAEDRTPQIVNSVITGIGNIAASVASGGFAVLQHFLPDGEGRPPKKVDTSHCNAKALAALAAQDALDRKLDAATAQLNVSVADMKLVAAATAGLGATIDPTVQAEWVGVARNLARNAQAVANAAQAAADNQKQFTSTFTFRFPVSGEVTGAADLQRIVIPGGPAAYKAWIKCSDAARREVDCADQPGDAFFVASVQIQPVFGSDVLPATSVAKGAASPQPDSVGLRYRVPARGQLVLCAAPSVVIPSEDPGLPACMDAANPTTWLPASANVIWEGPVAQLGRLQFMPYRNGPFQNNLLTATFNQDGSLAIAEFQDKASALETATGAFAQSTATTAQIVKAVQTGPTNRLNAQAAQLNAETAAIKARSDLLAAQAAASVSEQVALATANKALLDALAAQAASQLALQNAQAALRQGP